VGAVNMSNATDENLQLKLLTPGLWNLTVTEGNPLTVEH
jgi:hypothetical protein